MSVGSKFFSFDTHPHPVALDIVWCHFPERENPKRPGPKSRPALVRSVKLTADHKAAWIEVAYGTTKAWPKTHPVDLHIINSGDIDKCGLLRQTCFILDRVATLPWSPVYFCPRPEDGLGPIIGHLSDKRIQRLAALNRRKAAKRERA